jgi:hypothetical protein
MFLRVCHELDMLRTVLLTWKVEPDADALPLTITPFQHILSLSYNPTGWVLDCTLSLMLNGNAREMLSSPLSVV